MSEHRQCVAYRHTEQFCRNGFFQLTGFCSGKMVGCSHCGRLDEKNLPDCLRETPKFVGIGLQP